MGKEIKVIRKVKDRKRVGSTTRDEMLNVRNPYSRTPSSHCKKPIRKFEPLLLYVRTVRTGLGYPTLASTAESGGDYITHDDPYTQ